MTSPNEIDPARQRPLEEKDKIQILLHEYDTLRNEIIYRTGYGFQLTAIAVVLVGLLLTLPRSIGVWYVVIITVASVAVISLGGWWNVRDIWKASARLRELERDVNRRAGEDLLQWESYWGAAVAGWFGPSRPLGGRPKSPN